MFKLGGFKLAKLISNDCSLLLELGDENFSDHKLTGAFLVDAASHVLGLKWDHSSDTLVVSRGTEFDLCESVTQRTKLRVVSEVYDTICWVTPFTIIARLLLKDIWRLVGQQWVDPLSKDLVEMFASWSSEQPKQSLLAIPRSYYSGRLGAIRAIRFWRKQSKGFQSCSFSCRSAEHRNRRTGDTARLRIRQSASSANQSLDRSEARASKGYPWRSLEIRKQQSFDCPRSQNFYVD